MKTNLLSPDKDPMGAAIADYFNHRKADKLRVFSSQFEEDEIPMNQLFRPYDEIAGTGTDCLTNSRRKYYWYVGAGSGCHALALQEMGKEVCAIDISPRSVEVMEKRGVRNVRQMNLFDPHFLETFDTILMLMNGSGIIGKLENMAAFFQKMKQLLRPGGCILMDSSDLRYLFEDEDGSFLIRSGRRLLWRNRLPDAIQKYKRRFFRLALCRFSDTQPVCCREWIRGGAYQRGGAL